MGGIASHVSNVYRLFIAQKLRIVASQISVFTKRSPGDVLECANVEMLDRRLWKPFKVSF